MLCFTAFMLLEKKRKYGFKIRLELIADLAARVINFFAIFYCNTLDIKTTQFKLILSTVFTNSLKNEN